LPWENRHVATSIDSAGGHAGSRTIAGEEDEETDVVRQQVADEPVCFFNGVSYRNGDFVASGSQVLECSEGVWVDSGSTDTRNP
jgi:hypothetical protein